MTDDQSPRDAQIIDEKALDGLAVAPPDPGAETPSSPQGDAGSDRAITDRLEGSPDDADAQLDRGLDESMDASDPPSAVLPAMRDRPAGN